MADVLNSFKTSRVTGLGLDPIHVGAGGTRLGRVDNTIVRDPVTRLPKIPGSSLAGVARAYAAMALDKYDTCAGQGISSSGSGHCGKPDCRICTVFGFAKGQEAGGLAGLAAFSDAHLLLFPIASNEGPFWLSSPLVLQTLFDLKGLGPESVNGNAVFSLDKSGYCRFGWLNLPVTAGAFNWNALKSKINELGVPSFIANQWGIVSDRLFSYLVNSHLEVRTSVAIDPATGAAKDEALFTYEALPRFSVLTWEVTCRNPKHFKIGDSQITAVKSAGEVADIVTKAEPFLEHLGIGGMGSRGMGRLRVLKPGKAGV